MTHPSIKPSSEAIQNLRLELSQDLSGFPESRILGAQLGSKLNVLLQPEGFKSWIGDGDKNLRSFANLFLEGIVTPTQERQGLDILYHIENRPHGVVQSFSGALWKSFCSVRPSQIIIFEITSQALILSPLQSPITDTQQVIPSISDLEHRKICLAFAAGLDSHSPINQQVKALAEIFEPSLYSAWSSLLKAGSALFHDWGLFRGEQIKALFSSRLKEVCSDQVTLARLQSEFSADYDFQRSKNKLGSTALVQNNSAPAAVPLTKLKVYQDRVAIKEVLESIDEAQLSRIMVPMDVVLELLARQKS